VSVRFHLSPVAALPVSPWQSATEMGSSKFQVNLKHKHASFEGDGWPRSHGAALNAVLLVVACCCCMQPAACRSALYNTSATRLEGKLNVHIISHTHNDPGWLSSYAQYHRTLVLDGHTIGWSQCRALCFTILRSLDAVGSV
jgi:hypothetical protein